MKTEKVKRIDSTLKGQVAQKDCLTLHDGSDMLSRNVYNKLPSHAISQESKDLNISMGES
jgi:hypothetical protein